MNCGTVWQRIYLKIIIAAIYFLITAGVFLNEFITADQQRAGYRERNRKVYRTHTVTLDEHGWADVDELVAGISRRYPFDRTMLENIVAADEKKRYSFNEDHTKIRANHIKFEQSIDSTGLISKSRLYVHLSTDYDTAVKVGKRHGEPVIYRVLSGKMVADGFEFFLSENGVWLTKSVPAEYLEKL